MCEAVPLDALGRAREELIRARMAWTVKRDGGSGAELIVEAGMLETLDARLAQRTYLDALLAAIYPGRLGGSPLAVAEAALSAPRPPGPRAAIDLLLDGLALMLAEGYTTGV